MMYIYTFKNKIWTSYTHTYFIFVKLYVLPTLLKILGSVPVWNNVKFGFLLTLFTTIY